GFFGLIGDWVDLSLVRELALARPDWSITLIGKAATDLRPLQGLPNVHLLGPKPYASLPGYCRGFDVAILPYRKTEHIAHASPLKLREYLAAGKPIVSVPHPEVRQFGELVHVADSVAEFVQEIERCLFQDPSLCKRRMASVRT